MTDPGKLWLRAEAWQMTRVLERAEQELEQLRAENDRLEQDYQDACGNIGELRSRMGRIIKRLRGRPTEQMLDAAYCAYLSEQGEYPPLSSREWTGIMWRAMAGVLLDEEGLGDE